MHKLLRATIALAALALMSTAALAGKGDGSSSGHPFGGGRIASTGDAGSNPNNAYITDHPNKPYQTMDQLRASATTAAASNSYTLTNKIDLSTLH